MLTQWRRRLVTAPLGGGVDRHQLGTTVFGIRRLGHRIKPACDDPLRRYSVTMTTAVFRLQFLAAMLFVAGRAFGSVNEMLDLSRFVNVDLTCYTRGSAYPQRGGVIQIGGVPFSLAAEPDDAHTGVIQVLSDPALWVHCIKNGPRQLAIPGQQAVTTLRVRRSNVNAVYLLVNSAFGQCGMQIGVVEFVGGAGEIYRYSLREGVNVRDHYNGHYCNGIREFFGVANYGDVRLDAQRVELPRGFAGSLDRIVLRGFAGRGQTGAPFVAAITLNRGQEEVNSRVQYGDEVIPEGVVQSVVKYGAPVECLPNPKTRFCTPPNSSVTQVGRNLYKVVLPAHLVYGATVPNLRGGSIQVLEQSGTVCLATPGSGEPACLQPMASRDPGGPDYMDPRYAPGALLYQTANGETRFSINGRRRDQVPIGGSDGRAFRDYEGCLVFMVRIDERR